MQRRNTAAKWLGLNEHSRVAAARLGGRPPSLAHRRHRRENPAVVVRLLCPVLAAACCGMLRFEFLKYPELVAARKNIRGREKYDRFEPDQLIDQLIEESNSKKQKGQNGENES